MKKFLLPLLLLTCLFASCKRTFKDEVLGPESKSASSSFKLLDTLKANYFDGLVKKSKDTVAFQYIEKFFVTKDIDGVPTQVLDKVNYYKRNLFYQVKFNEEVSWKLSFTKASPSSYVKYPGFSHVIYGTSSYLDSSNTFWDGFAGNNIFAKGDVMITELSFLQGTDLVIRDTVKVVQGQYYPSSVAKVLNDFEDGLVNTYTYIDDTDPTPSPAPSIDKSINAPQGNSSLKIYGIDNNGDYFCGGMTIQKLDTETMKNYSPSDIYINLFIYGYPTPNSLGINSKATKLNVGVSENDLLSNDDPITGDVVFDARVEDTFEKQIAVDWVGWKLITVRYSDMVRSASKTSGGSGNGKFEPGRAYSVNCNLISSPNGSTVGANIDYVIMTYGRPFDASGL